MHVITHDSRKLRNSQTYELIRAARNGRQLTNSQFHKLIHKLTYVQRQCLSARVVIAETVFSEKVPGDTTKKSHTGVTKDLSGFVLRILPPMPP